MPPPVEEGLHRGCRWWNVGMQKSLEVMTRAINSSHSVKKINHKRLFPVNISSAQGISTVPVEVGLRPVGFP